MIENSSQQQTNKWLVALIVTVGVFMALLDTTIVDIALPKMMSAFEVDIQKVQWVVISYFLGSAISMACVGWLGDRFGTREIFIAGMGIFTLLSALCGLAPTIEVMNIARFLQGVGEGFILPMGMTLLFRAFPKEEHGVATGFFGLGIAFAPAVGPSLGGFITQYMSWRWIFYINLPFGFLAALAAWFLFAKDERFKRKAPFDWFGFLLMSASFSALIIFTTKGQEMGWLQSDFILALIILFAVTFPAFIIWQLKARHPLLDLGLFRDRNYAVGVAVFSIFSFSTFGFWLLLPVYLEKLRGFPTFTAGLVLLPGAIAGAVSMMIIGYMSDRWRPRLLLFMVLAGGMAGCFIFNTSLFVSKTDIAIQYGIWSIFIISTIAPLNVIALAGLKDSQMNMGTTFLNVVRLLFASIGTAYSTSLLSNKLASYFTVLSAKGNYSEPATREFVGRILFRHRGEVHGNTIAIIKAEMAKYITAYAASYSFEAVFRTLGIWVGLSLIVALLIKRPKTHGGHHGIPH